MLLHGGPEVGRAFSGSPDPERGTPWLCPRVQSVFWSPLAGKVCGLGPPRGKPQGVRSCTLHFLTHTRTRTHTPPHTQMYADTHTPPPSCLSCLTCDGAQDWSS